MSSEPRILNTIRKQRRSSLSSSAGPSDGPTKEDEVLCPLCLDELDVTDRNFKPCQCGYQMCRFCWHNIKENLNSKCPACRQTYDPDNYTFIPPDPKEMGKINGTKKKPKNIKIFPKRDKKEGIPLANRKNLANVRVIQHNLVYITNLALSLVKEDLDEYFGRYGKIIKIVVNKNNLYNVNSPGGPSVSAYVTYYRDEDARDAIQALDGSWLGGRTLRAAFGTTKYCTFFLKGVTCANPECMYLHELGGDEDSFTKEEMALGNFHDQIHPNLKSPSASNSPPTGTTPPGLLAKSLNVPVTAARRASLLSSGELSPVQRNLRGGPLGSSAPSLTTTDKAWQAISSPPKTNVSSSEWPLPNQPKDNSGLSSSRSSAQFELDDITINERTPSSHPSSPSGGRLVKDWRDVVRGNTQHQQGKNNIPSSSAWDIPVPKGGGKTSGSNSGGSGGSKGMEITQTNTKKKSPTDDLPFSWEEPTSSWTQLSISPSLSGIGLPKQGHATAHMGPSRDKLSFSKNVGNEKLKDPFNLLDPNVDIQLDQLLLEDPVLRTALDDDDDEEEEEDDFTSSYDKPKMLISESPVFSNFSPAHKIGSSPLLSSSSGSVPGSPWGTPRQRDRSRFGFAQEEGDKNDDDMYGRGKLQSGYTPDNNNSSSYLSVPGYGPPAAGTPSSGLYYAEQMGFGRVQNGPLRRASAPDINFDDGSHSTGNYLFGRTVNNGGNGMANNNSGNGYGAWGAGNKSQSQGSLSPLISSPWSLSSETAASGYSAQLVQNGMWSPRGQTVHTPDQPVQSGLSHALQQQQYHSPKLSSNSHQSKLKGRPGMYSEENSVWVPKGIASNANMSTQVHSAPNSPRMHSQQQPHHNNDFHARRKMSSGTMPTMGVSPGRNFHDPAIMGQGMAYQWGMSSGNAANYGVPLQHGQQPQHGSSGLGKSNANGVNNGSNNGNNTPPGFQAMYNTTPSGPRYHQYTTTTHLS